MSASGRAGGGRSSPPQPPLSAAAAHAAAASASVLLAVVVTALVDRLLRAGRDEERALRARAAGGAAQRVEELREHVGLLADRVAAGLARRGRPARRATRAAPVASVGPE